MTSMVTVSNAPALVLLVQPSWQLSSRGRTLCEIDLVEPGGSQVSVAGWFASSLSCPIPACQGSRRATTLTPYYRRDMLIERRSQRHLGWLAQPAERVVHTDEVTGSSPVPPTPFACQLLDTQSRSFCLYCWMRAAN